MSKKSEGTQVQENKAKSNVDKGKGKADDRLIGSNNKAIVKDFSSSSNEVQDQEGIIGDEVSFSSIPSEVIDTLLHADDETFAKFLSERRLSNNQRISPEQQQDNSLAADEDSFSSNPPPLILPPLGTVQYDGSFIEMVKRIVNRNRKNSTSSEEDNAIQKENSSQIERDELEEISWRSIEKARRDANVFIQEEDEPSSALLNVTDDENILFLQDDELPSFLYSEDEEEPPMEDHQAKHRYLQNQNKVEEEKALTKKGKQSTESHNDNNEASLYDNNKSAVVTTNIKGSPSREIKQQEKLMDYYIQWDDELDKSCNSIEAINLGNDDNDDNAEEVEHDTFDLKRNSITADDNNSELFEKDYSSWLCFDNEYGYVTLKKKTNDDGNQNQSAEEEYEILTSSNSSSIQKGKSQLRDASYVSARTTHLKSEKKSIHLASQYKLEKDDTELSSPVNTDIHSQQSNINNSNTSSLILENESNKDDKEHVLSDNIDITNSEQHQKVLITRDSVTRVRRKVEATATSTNVNESVRQLLEESNNNMLNESIYATAMEGNKSDNEEKKEDIDDGSHISSLSVISDIEKYIIATSTPNSTPNRNDSPSNNLFKTTPIKRRSSHQEDEYTANRFDYRSSPVRRRLIEAYNSSNNRQRYITTPSPPSVFPQDIRPDNKDNNSSSN